MTWIDPKGNPNCCNAFLKVKAVWFSVSAGFCPIVRYVDEAIPSIGTSEQNIKGTQTHLKLVEKRVGTCAWFIWYPEDFKLFGRNQL